MRLKNQSTSIGTCNVVPSCRRFTRGERVLASGCLFKAGTCGVTQGCFKADLVKSIRYDRSTGDDAFVHLFKMMSL